GPHEDRGCLHQRSDAHCRAHVIAEGQEGAAVDPGGALKGDPVENRRHGMLADPEVQGAPVWVSGEVRRRAGFGEERRRAVHRGVVGSGEVGRTAPQLGKYRSQSIEHLARSLTCGHLRAGLEGGRESAQPCGNSPERRRCSSCARSGLASCQAANFLSHSTWAAAPRAMTSRVCSMTSGSTSKCLSGSKPRNFFTPATSSAPSLAP